MDIMAYIQEKYKEAFEREDHETCEMLLDALRKNGLIPNGDKLDTINRMKGKKQASIM